MVGNTAGAAAASRRRRLQVRAAGHRGGGLGLRRPRPARRPRVPDRAQRGGLVVGQSASAAVEDCDDDDDVAAVTVQGDDDGAGVDVAVQRQHDRQTAPAADIRREFTHYTRSTIQPPCRLAPRWLGADDILARSSWVM